MLQTANALRQPEPTPLPSQSPPTTLTSLRSARQKAQTYWLRLTGMMAIAFGVVGMIYIFGHYQLARESFRQNALRQTMMLEKNNLHEANLARGTGMNAATIQQKAQVVGMLPGNEKETVYLP